LNSRPYLSLEELPLLRDFGIEIGNHTHNHKVLTDLDPEGVRKEISECSQRIADLTDARPRSFCYPEGRYNAMVRGIVAEANFDAVCSSRIGFNRQAQDLALLRRITIESRDGARALRRRLAGGYDFLDLSQRFMDAQ
jgi:peptidoglycan/xylan/chitin deacetylase (PgdA/CDA1 family)